MDEDEIFEGPKHDVVLQLDQARARELSRWIEYCLFADIRSDPDIDNIGWIEFWIKIMKQLEAVK